MAYGEIIKDDEVAVIPQWDSVPLLKDEFDFGHLCEERAKFSAQKEEAETKLKELNAQIGAALQITGTKFVRWGNFRVTQVNGRGPSVLDPKRLVQLGVDPAIVADATRPGKEYTTVQFSAIKEKVDDKQTA